MPKPSLNLIVLRAANLDATLNFYTTLGLTFVEEQHGSGPVHYSSEIEGTVIELFPGKPGIAPDRRNAGAVMIGFQVENVDQTASALESQGAAIITSPQQSTWGKRAVVQDPDGRAVELTQRA